MHVVPGETSQVLAVLRGLPLCDGLDESGLEAMAGELQLRPFAGGETLAQSEEVVKEFWIVIDGEIESFLTDTHGRETLLGVIHKGESIGEIAILENSPRPIRFTARTEGNLLAASAETFHRWIDTYPCLLRNLFRLLRLKFKRVIGLAERPLPATRLGILAASQRGQVLAARLLRQLGENGERLRIWADAPGRLRSSGAWPESLAIQTLPQVEQPVFLPASPDVDRQVVVWSPDIGRPPDMRSFAGCDEVLWLLEPGEAAAASQDFRQAVAVQPELANNVRIVWMLDAATPVAPLLPGFECKKPAIKAHVESQGASLTRLERQALGRLVRALRGYTLGLALAGGGAKGMAHLGVLRVLEEAGLSFDMMSGTSAGAMAGLMYAAGMPPQLAVESFQQDLTPSRLFRSLPKWPNWYLLTQFRRRAWENMLRCYLDDWRLEQLPIPFHAVTVDLIQVRPVVRSEGDAVHAILESINLPMISRPILRDGMALVDGGILNNLPADVLADRGADFVVGIDVSRRVRFEFGGNRPDMATHEMRPVGTLDTLLRIFEAQAHSIGNIRNRAVDFWITPDTSGFGLAEFYRSKEIAAFGQAAAEQKVDELKQSLAELERRLLGMRASPGNGQLRSESVIALKA